jgi:hypothetical protein
LPPLSDRCHPGEVKASPPFEPEPTHEVRVEGDDVQVAN